MTDKEFLQEIYSNDQDKNCKKCNDECHCDVGECPSCACNICDCV